MRFVTIVIVFRHGRAEETKKSTVADAADVDGDDPAERIGISQLVLNGSESEHHYSPLWFKTTGESVYRFDVTCHSNT